MILSLPLCGPECVEGAACAPVAVGAAQPLPAHPVPVLLPAADLTLVKDDIMRLSAEILTQPLNKQ